jgi:hypothetical protein
MSKFDELGRRKLRYWCFRFKQEADGGPSSDDAPLGLRADLEAAEHFGGWENYGVTWDWDSAGDRVVPIRYSLEQTWNAEAWASAKPLPLGEE